MSHGILLAVGILCTVLGIFARPTPAMADPSFPAVAVSLGFRRRLLAAGALVTAALAWAAQHAFHPGSRPFVLAMAIAALPVVIAALFGPVYAWMVRLAARDSGPVQALAARVRRISPVLALLPVGCMMLAGSFRDVFVVRGAMIYVPYLILLGAAGLTPKGRLGWVMIAPLVFVLWLHTRSVGWWLKTEHSPRDYKGFAETFRRQLRPDDLVLITNLYSDPPLLYYFPDKFSQFVPPAGYEDAIRRNPSSRVWIVLFEDQEMNEGMRAAVSGRRAGEPATAPGARGLLFLP